MVPMILLTAGERMTAPNDPEKMLQNIPYAICLTGTGSSSLIRSSIVSKHPYVNNTTGQSSPDLLPLCLLILCLPEGMASGSTRAGNLAYQPLAVYVKRQKPLKCEVEWCINYATVRITLQDPGAESYDVCLIGERLKESSALRSCRTIRPPCVELGIRHRTLVSRDLVVVNVIRLSQTIRVVRLGRRRSERSLGIETPRGQSDTARSFTSV
ncbi:hypothetical protein BaRGS_00016012, partial [Batillaria attramentaria]